MKSKKVIIFTSVACSLLIIVITVIFVSSRKEVGGSLVSPFSQINLLQKSSPHLTPIPSPGIKTFKFDKNTDLKEEIKKVDPKVLDSDFQ